MKKTIKKHSGSTKYGTTLIEILLYFTVLAIVLLAALTFAIQIFNVNRLSTNFQEVESNLDFISQKIVNAIQTAEWVNLADSILDNDQGALSLSDSLPDPLTTTFYLFEGNVFMEENTGPPIQLNSDLVRFDILNFHRVTFPKAPDQIVINATVSPVNTDIVSQTKQLTLNLAISLRNL